MKNYKLLKEQAIDLRLNQRKSIKEIKKILNVSQATVSSWVKGIKLTDEELKIRFDNKSKKGTPHKEREQKSKWFDIICNTKYSSTELGNICEVGIFYRLLMHQFVVYKSTLEGATVDFIVARRDNPNKLIKIQVKKCSKSKKDIGLPNIRVTRSDGRNKMKTYINAELDYLVGYDMYTDCAYIFSYDEIKNIKRYITIKKENKETWNLIK